MRRHLTNRFSSASRGTPVVAGEDGERDIASAAQTDDPAPAELDRDYRNRLLAYDAGKRAKADGMPSTFREFIRLTLCWQAGYDGESMPGFGED